MDLTWECLILLLPSKKRQKKINSKYRPVQVWLRGAPSTIGKNVKISTDRKLSRRNSREAKKKQILPQNSMKYH